MAFASDNDVANFVARQRTLLAREREAEVERTSLLLSNCSHKLLEQKGLALGGLGLVSVQIGLGGKSLIELERPSAYHTTPVFPPHTLRPGDLARIEEHVTSNSGKKSGTKMGTVMKEERRALDGVVYKVFDTKIVLAVDPSASNEDPDIPERCRLVKLANTVTYDRMDKAIDQLERLVIPNQANSTHADSAPQRSSSGPNALHRVLLGISSPTNPPSVSHITPTVFFDQSLNASQVAAVKFALHAPEVACIHGPPGTGKTRVLVEVIRQLVFSPSEISTRNDTNNSEQHDPTKPLRVLVCGASNLAVDNLLERLSCPTPTPASPSASAEDSSTTVTSPPQQQYPPISLTRLGHPARVLSSLHARTLDAQAQASDEAALVKDIKDEMEDLMNALSGSGPRGGSTTNSKGGRGAKTGSSTSSRGGGASGRSGAKKGQRLRGEERKKAWQTLRDLRKEYRKREGGVIKSVLGKAQVVLATCHGAGSRQLYNSDFDVVIIDEATQALEAVCWVPVLKARKLILAGDPLQLGPTIISEGNRRHAEGKKAKMGAGKASKLTTASKVKSTKTQEPSTTSAKADKGGMHVVEREGEETSDSDTSDSSSSVGNQEGNMSPTASKAKETKQAGNLASRRLLVPPKSLSTTMFERLEMMYNGKIKRMLNVQYRMNNKISAFPSKTLYHSRLSSHKSNASRLLRDLPGVSDEAEYEDIVGAGSEVVFWDTAGAEFWERSGNDEEGSIAKASLDDGGSLCNENEAAVVKRWVTRLIEAGVQPSDIAIITPYQAQSQVLSALLTDPGLEIGTADGMQGREREAVVLSLVRSNPEGQVGFLKDKRRLNVAMTRAKRHLCVVGDSSTIGRGGGKYLKKWMAWLEAEADVRFAGDEV